MFLFFSIQQNDLIKQLQDQHFQQYMQQVYQQQLLQQQQQTANNNSVISNTPNGDVASIPALDNKSSPIPEGVIPVPAVFAGDEEGM